MAVNYKKVWKGFKIVAKALSESDSLGDLEVLTTDNKMHYHNGTTSSPIVTETHAASLINKSLVDTSVTFVDSTDPTIQVKVDAAGTAGTSTTITSSQTVDRVITLPDTSDTLATLTQVNSKITGPVSSTDNAIVRYDGTTGKLAQDSQVTISDSGVISNSGTNADLVIEGNGLGKVDIRSSGLRLWGRLQSVQSIVQVDTASNFRVGNAKVFRLPDTVTGPVETIEPFLGGVESIAPGQEIILLKEGSNNLVIQHLTGTPSYRQINTGHGLPITIRPGDSLYLVYDNNNTCWKVIGSQLKNTTTAVDNAIPRFDGTSGNLIQDSNVIVNDLDEMSGLTKLDVDDIRLDSGTISTTDSIDLTLQAQSTYSVVVESPIYMKGTTRFQPTLDVSTGANVTIPLPTTRHIRLTDYGLSSIDMIQSPGGAQEIILENMTTNPITINNNTGATLSDRIQTGTGGAIKLAPSAALFLVHDGISWRVVGGTGGSATITKTAGETLSINDYVYISTGTGNDIGRTAGRVYKVDPTNDDRIEAVGFVASNAVLGDSVDITIGGVIDTLFALNAGKMYFADPTTPGAITDTPPSTGGQYIIPVGVAISTTELLISEVPDKQQVNDYNFTIANNQVAAADVTDLVFTGRSFHIDYAIYRQTDTALSGVAQTGQLRGVYNTQSSSWLMSDDYSGQNAGVNFSITSGGQIQYTSTNIAGTGYIGQLSYNVRKQF